MREDLARFFSIQKKAENVPKIYLGDIFRFFWGQIKYFPWENTELWGSSQKSRCLNMMFL